MRVLPFRQASSQRVLVRFTEDDEMERQEGKEREEGISSMVKKPFRCLVGMKPTLDGDDEMATPSLHNYQYVPPAGSFGDEFGFETIHNEKPKKSKPRKKETKEKPAVELEESFPTSVTHPLEEVPHLSLFRNSSLTRNRSFEETPPNLDALPQLVPQRNRTFVDAVPTPTKADPLDSASIRDVQKALREMERKLNAADTEGKRVSRSKVMKALLTVVDQLDEEYDYSAEVNVIGGSRPSSSLSLERPLSPEVISGLTSPRSNVAGGPKSPGNNLVSSHNSPVNNVVSGLKSQKKASVEELYRHWTGPSFGNTEQIVEAPPKEESRERPPRVQASAFVFDEMPWKGKPSSFTKMSEVKAAPTTETEEVAYISSPDESVNDSDEEGALFSGETTTHFSGEETTPFSGEETTLFSGEETIHFSGEETTLFSEKMRETRTTKGSFAHAVSPRRTKKNAESRRRKEKNASFSSGFDDFFHLDMKDPIVQAGVKDALRDLMWIPTSPKIEESKKEPVSSRPPVGRSPSSATKKPVLDKLQKERVAWYEEEGDDDDDGEQHESYEESTAATTRTFTPPRETTRDRSWWRRNRGLKPPSKDTLNVTKPAEHQMKVTVTSSDHWKDVLY